MYKYKVKSVENAFWLIVVADRISYDNNLIVFYDNEGFTLAVFPAALFYVIKEE